MSLVLAARRLRILLVLGLLVLAAVALPSSTEPVYADSSQLERTFLDPEPGGLRDAYGYALAALGTDLLIGAPEADLSGFRAGVVYLVDPTTGDLLQVIKDPVPSSSGGFGGNVVVLGEDFVATKWYPGAAYLLDGSTGALIQTFTNPPASNNGFGVAITVIGTDVLVGAPQDDTAGNDAGAAYLFDSITGSLKRTFLHPDPGEPSFAGDAFGHFLAPLGDNVIIAAPHDDLGATSAGAAYLYDPDDGALLRTFLNPAPSFNDQFGIAVASVGSTVMIGAPGEDSAGTNAGAAYLFDGETGALLRTFFSPTPGASDQFGVSIAAVGENFVIGSIEDDTAGKDAGAAFLFDQDGDLLATLLNPSPLDPYEGGFRVDLFGYPVAAMGSDILVAAPFDDTAGTDAGAVYLFRNPLLPKPTPTITPAPTIAPTATPAPVGGVSLDTGLRPLAADAAHPDGTPWAVVAAVAAAGLLAAGGAASYARRRRGG